MLIKRPLVTEKSIANQNVGKYSFVVDKRATKFQLASEFEKLFAISIRLIRVIV